MQCFQFQLNFVTYMPLPVKKKKKAQMRNLKWISVYLLIANVIFLTHRNLRPLDQKRNRKHLLLKQAFIRR